MKCIGVPDVAKFSERAESLMYAKLNRIDEAIELFEALQNT